MMWWVVMALAEPCAACHPVAYEQWSETRHAHAYDNAAFQQAFAASRDPWCLTCHDPTDGVSCADCHTAPHTADAAPVDSQTCASCHQFNVPDGGVLQDTVAEWQASGADECATCHLQGHTLRGPRDQDFVRDALSARYRDGAIVLTARHVGHRVPTGDPWRRLEIELLDDSDVVVRTYMVQRRVAGVGESFQTVWDNRLPVPQRGRAQRRIDVDPEGAVAWRVVFALTDPAHPGDEPEWTLAEGRL